MTARKFGSFIEQCWAVAFQRSIPIIEKEQISIAARSAKLEGTFQDAVDDGEYLRKANHDQVTRANQALRGASEPPTRKFPRFH